jgi:hypothetical protein
MSNTADNAPPGNYEHLKNLEPLIGTWIGEWVIAQDRPTAGIKKGKNLPVTVTFKWDVNKSAILSYITAGELAAPVWGSIWLIGWDTANKRIFATTFEFTGGHAVTHDWEIKGDKVTVKAKGSLPAGNKTAWTMVFSDITKDSFVYQMTDLTVDGKEIEPGLLFKWTLKRAEDK